MEYDRWRYDTCGLPLPSVTEAFRAPPPAAVPPDPPAAPDGPVGPEGPDGLFFMPLRSRMGIVELAGHFAMGIAPCGYGQTWG